MTMFWLTPIGQPTESTSFDPDALTWRKTTPIVRDGEVVGMATLAESERDGETWLTADVVSDEDLTGARFDLDVDIAVERFDTASGHWVESGVVRRLIVVGHDPAAEAEAILASLNVTQIEDDDEDTDDEDMGEPVRWEGVAIIEGELTGDGRMFEAGSVRWDESQAPWPLKFDREEGDHSAAVVGEVTRIWRDGNAIRIEGIFHTRTQDPETLNLVNRAIELVQAEGAVSGVSMEWDQASSEVRIDKALWDEHMADVEEFVDEEMEEVDGRVVVDRFRFDEAIEVTTDMRLTGIAIVDRPAYPEAGITVVASAHIRLVETITAAVIGDTSLPVADRDRDWDGPQAKTNVFDFYTDDDGNVDTDGVAKAFVLRDDDADPETQTAYSLGFADVIDGTLTIVPSGVAATAGGRGISAVEGISDDERARAESRICSLYAAVRDEYDDWPDCPFDDSEASIQAHAAAVETAFDLPPRSWFEMAEPSEDDERVVWVDDEGAPCAAGEGRPWGIPLTITADGQLFGHLASWQDCHTGFEDRCLTPPRSASGYAWFHTGATETADGPVPTGRITVDTSHAPHRMSAASAVAHYDQTGHAVADVHVVDGELGPWMTGWVRPWATQQQRHELTAHPPSGDWRPRGGSTELIGVLCVNVPGFPLPRSVATYRAGELASLVASGFAPRGADDEVTMTLPDDVWALRDRLSQIEARLEAEQALRFLETV